MASNKMMKVKETTLSRKVSESDSLSVNESDDSDCELPPSPAKKMCNTRSRRSDAGFMLCSTSESLACVAGA